MTSLPPASGLESGLKALTIDFERVPKGLIQLATEHEQGYINQRTGSIVLAGDGGGAVLSSFQHQHGLPGLAFGRKDLVDLVDSAADDGNVASGPVTDAWNAAVEHLGAEHVAGDWGRFGPDGFESGGNYRTRAQYFRGIGDGSGERLLEPREGDAAGVALRNQLGAAFSRYTDDLRLHVPEHSGE
jgi:hypothetical protein